MIDKLLLAIVVVAKEITFTYDYDLIFLHEQFWRILKLKIEVLVVVEEVDTDQLVAS